MPRRLSFTGLGPSEQPLIFLALAFIGGLLSAARFPFPIYVWFVVAVAWWLAAAVCLFRRQTAAVLLFAGCVAAGGLLWTINEASVGQNRVRRLFERGELRADEPIELIAMLDAAPGLAPERIYLSLTVERCATLGKEFAASGAVQMVVPFNEDEQSRREYDRLALDYGTRIRLLGNLTDKGGYLNPGAPKFDEMLEYRSYDAAGWIKSPLLIERLGEGRRNAALAWLYGLRAQAIAVCLRSFKQPASGILVAAL